MGRPDSDLVSADALDDLQSCWSALATGVQQVGRLERRARDGSQRFLQGTYTPIVDLNGNPYKVVLYATDVTSQVMQIRAFETSQARYGDEVMRIVDSLRHGDLAVRGDVAAQDVSQQAAMRRLNEVIEAVSAPVAESLRCLQSLAVGMEAEVPGQTHQGSFGDLAEAVGALVRTTNDIARIAGEIADGDLTLQVTKRSDDDALMGAMARMVQDLSRLIRHAQRSAQELNQESDLAMQASDVVATNAQRSASTLTEVSTVIERISRQTQQNAANAESAQELATEARSTAALADERMQAMMASMKNIEYSSVEISRVIKVIDDIAFQTNLLSLNAAVEAGRAGEHGRGFAVVAEEVRRLAARSTTAARETASMIQCSTQRVTEGLELADATASSLHGIVQAVEDMGNLLREIAASSAEQAAGIVGVYESLAGLGDVSRQNSAKSTELARAARQVSSHSATLGQNLSRFRLPTEPENLQGVTPELLQALQQYMSRAQGV